ncbi:His/Gly/Thr/Pro-type tRNA ligase C-terminal domain-containing protein, partial [Bacillus sp. HC-Mk]
RPVVIHRAVLGSLDRFLAILIEHFGGAFPAWVAPVQVKVIPVSNAVHEQYANEIAHKLAQAGVRVEQDARDEDPDKKEDPAAKENPNEKTELSEEQRSAISASIAAALSTKGHRAKKETEIRSVFANYIVGNIDEKEARALGLVTGNGSVGDSSISSNSISVSGISLFVRSFL